MNKNVLGGGGGGESGAQWRYEDEGLVGGWWLGGCGELEFGLRVECITVGIGGESGRGGREAEAEREREKWTALGHRDALAWPGGGGLADWRTGGLWLDWAGLEAGQGESTLVKCLVDAKRKKKRKAKPSTAP